MPKSWPAGFKVPLVRVQHHHAHVAACMAEHGLEGPVLGLSWDGTGYGPDGTIWGGEALLCRGADYHRVAHLRTFPLPGGDRAARQPRRAALGLLYEILGPEAFEGRQVENLACVTGAVVLRTPNSGPLAAMLARGLNCPRTSSMGRLFDAVAALCGLGQEMTFEGQAAMKLEFAAEPEVSGILFDSAAGVGKRTDCRLGTDDPADPGRTPRGRTGRPNQCPFP